MAGDTLIDPNRAPAGVPRPLLVAATDLSVPIGGPNGRRQRYPIEIWEVANGRVYALITDVRGNASLLNAQEDIAAAVRAQWPAVDMIIEYWPDGVIGGETCVQSSENGGHLAAPRDDLAQQGLFLPN
ncbi:hypothetical protein MUG78_16930 [Gordonia alkaliphila]|uniref:hypothetical protein n=1 Tax=Gordonia alkaliphila TaxID=1053547 RepID=UPI001FF119FA|nr:hypothetical protein [Gordonia alkaliphila]MCK0441086.1 hypothetical protein [Gordonia alkaliphila]